MKLPLEGIKVVELGTHVAIPNVARIMADWGATAIKVEGLGGEEWRIIGRSNFSPIEDDENPMFTLQNANKKFIALDLKNPEGKEAMLKLIKECDVFLCNVRLKSIKKMGLDYDSLKAVNDKLIYVHFSGYGYEGPDAAKPGFDVAAYWARSGAAVDGGDVGAFPIKMSTGFGDSTVSSILLSATLAALIARDKCGKGTFITSSLYASAIWYCATGVTTSQYGNVYPKSKDKPGNPLAHTYLCKDGEWMLMSVVSYDKLYAKTMNLLGLGQYAEDPRFTTMLSCREHLAEFMPIIVGRFLELDSKEWDRILTEGDVVHEICRHHVDCHKDPQALVNGYFQEVTFPNGNKAMLPKVPIQFSEYPVDSYIPTGAVGRDTDEILAGVGYTPEQIAALKANKATK